MKTQIIKICGCLLIAAAALFGSLTASADTVYVSYPSNNTIEKFDLATGTDLGVFASTGLSNPRALVFDGGSVPEPSSFTLAGLGAVCGIAYCSNVLPSDTMWTASSAGRAPA